MTPITKALASVHHIDDDANRITVGSSGGGGMIGGSSAGNLTITGASNISVNGASGGFYNFHARGTIGELPPPDLTFSQDDNLPDVVFDGHDFDSKKITMTLKPESTISTLEALKITMLINASARTPTKFSVFAYIKKNNLERHFKFVQ